MVYSQTKRTASISSITNQNQGGGSKKAGFPYLVGRDSATSIAFHRIPQFLGNSAGTTAGSLRFTLNPNVRQSRPIGVPPTASRYFTVM
jgi:hypothetical protein